MQRQGGGGNDPSCGCDMQAGWPSASELPRGGIKGGGNWNFNEFNLALTKNGQTRHLRGKWNNQMKTNMNKNSINTNTNNTNTNTYSSNINMNSYTNNMNNNSMNSNNNTKKNNNSNSSALNSLEKKVLNGKRYYTNPQTGNTYSRHKNGKKGKYVGKMISNANGKLSLNTSIPMTNVPPSLESEVNDYDTIESNEEPKTKPLTSSGGGMPACGSCPFPGTGYCDFYAKGGGGCGCAGRKQTGGGCGCAGSVPFFRGGKRNATRKGGYKATKRNLKYLKKWKEGKSIGFTMTSSLKAKGLIPRTSKTMKGKRIISKKYQ